MARLILRPLFVFLTLAMLVLAVFQVSGRLMFAFLDDLQAGVNQWLAPQDVVVHGLEGDWHGVNPVVRIARITLPAGELHGVEVELDWLESLVRNRLVARQVSLEGGRLLLERTAAGWRLLGAGKPADFNPFATLYQSDQIDVALSLGFVGEDGVAHDADDLLFRYRATNRGGEHRHRLSIDNPDCAARCRITLAADDREAVPFLRSRSIQASLSGGGLRIPEPLVAAGEGGTVDTLTGSWWRSGETSGGKASVHLSGLRLDDDVVSGGFSVLASGAGDLHHLELEDLAVTSGERSWTLPGFLMTLEAGTDHSLLEMWTERIDTGSGFEFLTALVPRETAVFRWLSALNVRATALNVHAFVRFPDLLTGYVATVRDVSLDGYNGAPWVRGAAGELLGANRVIQLNLNSQDLGVQFPDMFHQRWTMDHLSGRLRAYVSGDYFGFKGTDLRADLDGSHASGGFALTRPRDARYRERLSLLINIDRTTVERGKQYIPYQLPTGLPEWLDAGPRSGDLSDVAFAYHGQIHTRPFELARRVAFRARIDDGVVQYHPDWPAVRDLAGTIGVSGGDVRIDVDRGHSLEQAQLAGTRIHLTDNATYADIDLQSRTSVDEALTFVRTTPLAEWMSFVAPDWSGSGPVELAGRLRVPLKLGEEHIGEVDDLEVDLDIDLAGADLNLPTYGVALGDLEGRVHYTYPFQVVGSDVRGRIFDRPAIFAASADDDTVIFHVEGQAPYEDVLSLLAVQDPGGIRGGFDFSADLYIELGTEISRLDVLSDLAGLALTLPGELAKAPDDAVPTEMEIRFLPAYQAVRFRYGTTRGWMHVDGTPLRGAIGFSAPPPLIDPGSNELVLGGHLGGFSLEEVVPDGQGGGSALPIPVRLADLEVGLVDVNGVPFHDVRLDGVIGAGADADITLALAGPDAAGNLRVPAQGPLVLDLTRLHLPASGSSDEADPLDVSVIPELVPADVAVGRFLVGETDYGRWSFKLRPEDAGVALEDLDAELRGVHIVADRLFWDGAANRTHFGGTLTAGDLATVLPQWGYAPSVRTEKASMTAELSWEGSPAAVELDRLAGNASFSAKDGRFLEVTQGTDAMKIFSLVNFSKIARRLNFDFSDVVGEGVSFDSVTATTEFDEGTMKFLEPMTVEGSGSSFRIAGQVDLVDGTLDNEMIVTLPVTKGLPWYAAYVALANPLAGLGVLVGERMLRKPLEQFSSAKYEIRGTLDDPELKFVSVWDTRMNRPQVSLEQVEGKTGETPPATKNGEKPSSEAKPVDDENATAQNSGTTG